MTTSLALRLEKNTPTEMGGVATLQRIADETGKVVRGGRRINVVIPANSGGDARTVAVDPGRWLVEATLPSGEIITEEVEVAGGQALPVTLQTAEKSPHEWLAWQHLIGNIEGEDTLALMRASARDIATKMAQDALGKQADPKLVARIADFAADAAEYALHKIASLARTFQTGTVRAYRRLERGQEHADTNAPTDAPVPTSEPTTETSAAQLGMPVVQRFQRDNARSGNSTRWGTVLSADPPTTGACSPVAGSGEEATWVYRFEYPTPLPEPHGDPIPLPRREIVHVEWAKERFVISLPLPWPALAHQRPVPAEVMVRMHPLERRVQIGVAVLDETFGPLSGLMTASTLPKAAIAVEQAYGMLYEKVNNPLAAAAGGYVLIAASDPKKTDWHQWIDNLEDWFPEMPDGAVLKGMLRLRYPRGKDSPREAREAFLRAFDRGIPYFSAGVAWLLDGLTVFPDDEIQEKANQVQRVAQRLDLAQAFTVIRLSEQIKR
jgi:hypothetical protein